MRFHLQLVFILASIPLLSYGQFTYLSPKPESKMHNKETGIILRTGGYVDASSLSPDLFLITGTVSGIHHVKVKLALDDKTILIHPETYFAAEETVVVNIKEGIRNSDGTTVYGTTFQFQIRSDITAEEQELIDQAMKEIRQRLTKLFVV